MYEESIMKVYKNYFETPNIPVTLTNTYAFILKNIPKSIYNFLRNGPIKTHIPVYHYIGS